MTLQNYCFFLTYARVSVKKTEKNLPTTGKPPAQTENRPEERFSFRPLRRLGDGLQPFVFCAGRKPRVSLEQRNIHCSLFIIHYSLFISFRVARRTARRRSSSSTPAGFFYAARLSAFPFGIFCGLLVLKKFRPLNPHCMRTKKSSSVSRALDARLPSPFFHCRAIGLPALPCPLYFVLCTSVLPCFFFSP